MPLIKAHLYSHCTNVLSTWYPRISQECAQAHSYHLNVITIFMTPNHATCTDDPEIQPMMTYQLGRHRATLWTPWMIACAIEFSSAILTHIIRWYPAKRALPMADRALFAGYPPHTGGDLGHHWAHSRCPNTCHQQVVLTEVLEMFHSASNFLSPLGTRWCHSKMDNEISSHWMNGIIIKVWLTIFLPDSPVFPLPWQGVCLSVCLPHVQQSSGRRWELAS